MGALQEIGAIWKGETQRALRSGRVLALLVLFVLFVGLALAVVGFLVHQLNVQFDAQLVRGGADAAQAQAMAVSAKRQFLAFVITDDVAMQESLAGLPLLLLVVFKLTLRFLPLLIALMGFDQLSGELGPRSIRFLVVRARRDSIILGKALSQATVLAPLLLVSTALMVGVTRALTPDFAAAEVAAWTGRLLLASAGLSLAYLALTALCSAVTRQGAVSLLLNLIVLFVIWYLAAQGEAFRLPGEVAAPDSLTLFKAESPLGYLRYLSVWHYGSDLLHPQPLRFFTAALMHVGFGLVFLGLAQLWLRRRDL